MVQMTSRWLSLRLDIFTIRRKGLLYTFAIINGAKEEARGDINLGAAILLNDHLGE